MGLQIRPATVEDCAQIAGLHRMEIRGGFLSDLGPSFLGLLYRSMITSRSAFCKIAEEDGRVVGFISGAESTGGFYKEFLKKNSLKAGLMLFRKMAEPKTVVRIFETLLYPVRRERTEGGKGGRSEVEKVGSWEAGKDLGGAEGGKVRGWEAGKGGRSEVGKLGGWEVGRDQEKFDVGKAEVHAELFSIVVEEKCRSKGIAQALFLELKNEFERRGVKKFKVVAGADLKAACRFYEKMGGVLAAEIEVHRGERSLVYVWEV